MNPSRKSLNCNVSSNSNTGHGGLAGGAGPLPHVFQSKHGFTGGDPARTGSFRTRRESFDHEIAVSPRAGPTSNARMVDTSDPVDPDKLLKHPTLVAEGQAQPSSCGDTGLKTSHTLQPPHVPAPCDLSEMPKLQVLALPGSIGLVDSDLLPETQSEDSNEVRSPLTEPGRKSHHKVWIHLYVIYR